MAEGYIGLYRCLLDKPIWQRSTPEQKVIFITLLLMANHKENEWEWQGKKFKVQPGQMITSLESISEKSGCTIKNVRTAIQRFEKLEFLANESAKTGRLITILNWQAYQVEKEEGGKATGKQVAKTRQRGGKGVATNNNDNNDNNVNNKYIICQHLSMTEEEYKKLVSIFGEDAVKDKIKYAENYAKLKNYKSLYLTLNNWLDKDKGGGQLGTDKLSREDKPPTQRDKSKYLAQED